MNHSRWAWQHGKDSRHVESDESTEDITINPKTGKVRTRKKRSSQPPRSLTAHLANLHLMLRSTYFSSWPLTVRFFSGDVHRVWKAWSERVDGFLPDNVKIVLDGDCTESSGDDARVGSIQQIQANYSKIQDYLEKAMFLLDDPQDLRCRVCEVKILPEDELIVVCPQANCCCTSHLICLSKAFLNAAGEPDQFVPTHGSCPACKEVVQWPLMMKELSLRSRGGKELQAMLKRKNRRKGANGTNPCVKEADINSAINRKGRPGRRSLSAEPTSEDRSGIGRDALGEHALEYFDLDDDWMDGLDFESDSDAGRHTKSLSKEPPPRLETVIEDSDWDDVEVLD